MRKCKSYFGLELLSLFLLFLAFGYAQSQIDLRVAWQKTVKTAIISAKISNDGKFVYVTNPGWNTIRKMSLETGEYISAFDNTNYNAKGNIDQLFLSNDGTKLISQSGNTVCIWDVMKEKVIKEIYFDSTKGTYNGISQINVSSNGKILAVNFYINTAKPKDFQSYILFYDLELNKEVSRFESPDNGSSMQVCFSYDLKFLAIGYIYLSQTIPIKIYTQKVCILNAENGMLIRVIDIFDNVDILDYFYEIEFSQDNNLIAYSTSYNQQFRIMNLNQNKYVAKNDDNRGGFLVHILPNNLNYINFNGDYTLELHNFEKKINTYHLWPECSDLKLVNGKTKLFNYGAGEIALLDEIPLGIEEVDTNTSSIFTFYNIQDNSLKIQNLPINTQSIQLSDLNGKNLLIEDMQNVISNQKIININLPNGIYLLNIKTNGQDIVQKFQVRR